MAQIIGAFRLGRDCELRYTPGGDPVANLALAFNYGKRDANNDRPSQWVDAALWGKRAEALQQYLTKGTQVYAVLSDPHIEEYQGKNGTGHKLVANVLDIELVGGRQSQQPQQSQQQSQPAPQQSRQAQNAQAGQRQQQKPSFDDLDDDITF